MDADRRRDGVEVGDVVGGQRNAGGAGVLFEPFAASGSRDGGDPLVLGQQPRKGDLSGCGIPGLGEGGDVVEQCLVGGAVARCEPGDGGADVACGELGAGAARRRLPA